MVYHRGAYHGEGHSHDGYSYNRDGDNTEAYYVSPPLSSQPLETRSASVSSTSSTASYSVPHSVASAQYAAISRTLSPAYGVPGAASNNAMYHRSQYSGFEQAHASHGHPPSFPSQFLQSQIGACPPHYSPLPNPRHASRPPPYGGYPVALHHQQPSPISYDSYSSSLYQSFPPTAYEPSPALPSYHLPPVSHNLVMAKHEESKGSWLTHSPRQPPRGSISIHQLQRLPPEVISKIREMLGWEECRKIYHLCRIFWDLFHPSKLSQEAGVAGVLKAEMDFGRRSAGDSSGSRSRAEGRGPSWLGCYHCFLLKPFNQFEMGHTSPSSSSSSTRMEEADDDGHTTPGGYSPHSSGAIKREHSLSPPSTTTNSNPYYDSKLTRTSLMMNMKSARSRPYPSSSSSPSSYSYSSSRPNNNRRAKETLGIRRFCVDCGLKLGIYQPGAVIDLQRPQKNGTKALWVCQCRVLRRKSGEEVKCRECGAIPPLSSPADYLVKGEE